MVDRVKLSVLTISFSIVMAGCAGGSAPTPLMIVTPAVADGTVGIAYNQTIEATGGSGPFTWSLAAGTVPTGLSLEPTSAASLVISGTPLSPYTSINFTVTVTDAKGSSAAKQYTMMVKTLTVAQTASGQVQGVVEGDLVAFRGIPFAAPPTGNLRWKPPTPPTAWQGIRDASSFGNVCPQVGTSGQIVGDEDCLTVNVFESKSPGNSQQPVMVYFHGGGNDVGSAHEPPLDSPPLATHGVIVVTAQYRLGLLGFFANPLLTAEGGGSSGNYALLDQIAALEWVQKNIKAFGGDPDRVTMFGESASGYDLQALLVSPRAQGLFARAAMESSNAVTGGRLTSLATLETEHAVFVSLLGCKTASDVLACLRAAPTETLVNAQGTRAFGPAIEPLVVPVDPITVLQQQGSPVPLLLGSNREESTGFGDHTTPLITSSAYSTAIHKQFDTFGSGVADQILALYPVSDYDTVNYALIAVHSDYKISCQTRKVALAASGSQRPPVWRFLFTHRFENNSSLNALAAFHTAELFFVFGNLQFVTSGNLSVNYAPSAAEQAFSNQMMEYWARFATNGNPNGTGASNWPQFGATDEELLQLDEAITSFSNYHKSQCNYVADLPLP